MPTRFDVALIDFGQVISLPISAEAMSGMAAIADCAVEDFAETYWRLRHGYDVDVPPAHYWSGVAGRRLTDRDVDALVNADNAGWTVLNPDTVAALEDARAAGLRLVLLSNAAAVFAPAFHALPVAGLFELTVFSGEVGVAKPDPRIYTIALDRAGVPPERSFFVDDRPGHVEAARGVGVTASVFSDAAALRADLGLPPAAPAT